MMIDITYDNDTLDDIAQIINFNYLLKTSTSNPKLFSNMITTVDCLEMYKVFWLWLHEQHIIKDIIVYLFDILLSFGTNKGVKIPLLLMR